MQTRTGRYAILRCMSDESAQDIEAATVISDDFAMDETAISTHLSPPSSGSGSGPGTRDTTELQGRVAGRYEIQGLIGRGGMGNVYRVRDLELDEIVALKTLHSELASSESAIGRFRAEVKLARRVTHRNVARTFDIGTTDDGIPFLTMEFVDGNALGDVMRCGTPFGVAEVLEIMIEIADGLHAAHEAGVIHQDLKPQNVIVETGGRIVISDFGIARARDACAASTRSNGFAGTPAYMAPEQVRGDGALDGRADLFARGGMMFEMLTGKLPFNGPTPLATALARMVEPTPDLPTSVTVPSEVARVVRRCMERERDARFADASRLRAALSAALSRVATGAHQGAARSMIPQLVEEKSVAVLPLRLRGSADASHLAEGITEELIDGLSMCDGLRVKPRSAVMKYVDDVDAQLSGRQLGVQVVVEGSVRVEGESLRVRLAAISVEDGFQLWAKRFNGCAGDIFKVCGEATGAIAEALTVDGGAARAQVLTDPVTIDLYLRARKQMWAQWHSHTERALPLWEEVLERAPDDPRVLAGAATFFARLDHNRGMRGESRGAYSKRARQCAVRASQAAPDWPEPYCAKAVIAWNAFDLGAALREARRAIAVAPAHVEGLVLASKILMEIGPLDEALAHLEAARQLDPNEYNVRWELVRARAMRREWDEVDALLSLEVHEPNQRFARTMLRCRTDMWRDEPQWLDVEESEAPDSEFFAFYVPDVKHILRTNTLPAHHDELIELLEASRATYPRTASVGFQHATEWALRVGRDDVAWPSLEKAVEVGLVDVMWLRHCPLLDRVRQERAFQALENTVAARSNEIHRAAELGA